MKSDPVDFECHAACTRTPRVCDRVIVSVVVFLLLLFDRMIDFYQRLGALLIFLKILLGRLLFVFRNFLNVKPIMCLILERFGYILFFLSFRQYIDHKQYIIIKPPA